MNPELNIHIVAYKRPKVLQFTLQHILAHITPPKYFSAVNITIAVNESDDEYKTVTDTFRYSVKANSRPHIKNSITDVNAIHYKENMGKAYALNQLKREYANPGSFIVTMDDDMVFTGHFMPIFEDVAQYLNFELVGFASEKFYASYPERHDTVYKEWREKYKVWHTMSIAGGIMMGTYDFFSENEWTNVDGIYGGDDFNMSFLTSQKFVVEDESDWLVHDPYGPKMPELERYYQAKEYWRSQGLFVYPHGWLENAEV